MFVVMLRSFHLQQAVGFMQINEPSTQRDQVQDWFVKNNEYLADKEIYPHKLA